MGLFDRFGRSEGGTLEESEIVTIEPEKSEYFDRVMKRIEEFPAKDIKSEMVTTDASYTTGSYNGPTTAFFQRRELTLGDLRITGSDSIYLKDQLIPYLSKEERNAIFDKAYYKHGSVARELQLEKDNKIKEMLDKEL